MKATPQQIDLIDTALKKAGINYIDIRMEMTDHIAAILEEKDDRFEHHLKGYMLHHKKELKKTNRRFILIAMGKTYRQFLGNLIKPRILMLFAAVYASGFALNVWLGRADTVLLMFLAFIFVCCRISTPVLYNTIFRKKHEYSSGFGFSLLYLFVLYPTIYTLGYQKTITSDTLVLLYYTAVIVLCVVMLITMKQFNKQYKLRYNV